MKKCCKHEITPNYILPFIYDCLMRHKNRRSTRTAVRRTVGLDDYELEALKNNDYPIIVNIAYRLSEYIADSIKNRSIPVFKPVITVKHDTTTNKERLIGREEALQQFYDYVAVYGCDELWKRKLVLQQCSSIKNRGQVYGMKLIKSYIDADNRQVRYAKKHKFRYTRQCKYFVKLDIKKCYPSIDKQVLFDKLKHDIGSDDILYLWKSLLDSYGNAETPDNKPYTGLMIGALPSQFAAQLLISDIYRFTMNQKERGKNTASHMVIFMDDMLIFASNRRKLKRLVESVIAYAREHLHLTIKPIWHIRSIDKCSVDMMGYVVHKSGKVTMRTRNFIHARRLIIRMGKQKYGYRSLKRLVSYKGFFMHSNSLRTLKQYKAVKKFETAQNVLSGKAKNESLLRNRTSKNQV